MKQENYGKYLLILALSIVITMVVSELLSSFISSVRILVFVDLLVFYFVNALFYKWPKK